MFIRFLLYLYCCSIPLSTRGFTHTGAQLNTETVIKPNQQQIPIKPLSLPPGTFSQRLNESGHIYVLRNITFRCVLDFYGAFKDPCLSQLYFNLVMALDTISSLPKFTLGTTNVSFIAVTERKSENVQSY